MPIYVYECTSCRQKINIFHSFTEKPTRCELCGVSDSLQRDYSTPFSTSSKLDLNEGRVGQIVEAHIEQTRKEIKKEKEDLKKERFNDE